MATAATLWVKLGLDSKGYNSGLDKAEKKGKSAAKNIGDSFTKAGKAMTLGLTVPIVAGAAKIALMASNMEESTGAVETVFGNASAAVFEFGETVGESAGLAQEKFQSLAIVTGSLLQNMGFSMEEAAEQTNILTSRASDMAAVFGTDVSQALEAIQSGLKGEFNPLEQFGVKMNQAAITAKALSLGLADTKAELDDNAKATAALALVMEQTDRIAGTFATEAEGLSGTLKTTKAALSDAAVEMGTHLLPIAIKVVKAVGDLAKKFKDLTPRVQKQTLVFAGFLAVLGPTLLIIGKLTTAFLAIQAAVIASGVSVGILITSLSALVFPIALIAAGVALMTGVWREFGEDATNTLENIWGLIQMKLNPAVFQMQLELDAAAESASKADEILGGAAERTELMADAARRAADSEAALATQAEIAAGKVAELEQAEEDAALAYSKWVEGVRDNPLDEIFGDTSSVIDNINGLQEDFLRGSEGAGAINDAFGDVNQALADGTITQAEWVTLMRDVELAAIGFEVAIGNISKNEGIKLIASETGVLYGEAQTILEDMDAVASAMSISALVDEAGRLTSNMVPAKREFREIAEFAAQTKQSFVSLNGKHIKVFIDITETTTTVGGGGGTTPDAGGATGMDNFTVPGGFPNDSFLVAASSNEVINIDTVGQQRDGAGMSDETLASIDSKLDTLADEIAVAVQTNAL